MGGEAERKRKKSKRMGSKTKRATETARRMGGTATRMGIEEKKIMPMTLSNQRLHAECLGRTSVVTCQFSLAQAAGEPCRYEKNRGY